MSVICGSPWYYRTMSVSSAELGPIAKMAGLKKLKTGNTGERQVLGAEISSVGVSLGDYSLSVRRYIVFYTELLLACRNRTNLVALVQIRVNLVPDLGADS